MLQITVEITRGSRFPSCAARRVGTLGSSVHGLFLLYSHQVLLHCTV